MARESNTLKPNTLAIVQGSDSIAAFRLLRACASLGLVTFDGLTFTATPLLGTSRADVPGSLRSYAITFPIISERMQIQWIN
jgi:hypothetical protein